MKLLNQKEVLQIVNNRKELLEILIDMDMVSLLKIIQKHEFSGSDISQLLERGLEDFRIEFKEFFNDVYDLNVEITKEDRP
ncbi:hypothetical protein D0469_07080 [Peribacillus saganii]|uniref:Uncharacterized protein n=1 Tax=Peribacillus saganii TaxID=2303992 RepID=A0A372LR04_9BACI|nr:hypothetical protein [Peribacillus saganii]RFU70357.1 hypothetical protein D0469_07080 [Peribacillus saganii]